MEKPIRGKATKIPLREMFHRFSKMFWRLVVWKIASRARGTHPIKDELLTMKAKVIADVILAMFASKTKC